MTESESSFNLNCFEDDFEKHMEEINDYYEYLENHGDYLELSWKNPGRTVPKVEEVKPIAETPKESASNKNMEFDFDFDESPNSSKLNQINRTPKAITANKKKSATTFNSVMEKLKKRT